MRIITQKNVIDAISKYEDDCDLGVPANGSSCPLANLALDINKNIDRVEVDTSSITYVLDAEYHIEKLPKWASLLVNEIDDYIFMIDVKLFKKLFRQATKKAI